MLNVKKCRTSHFILKLSDMPGQRSRNVNWPEDFILGIDWDWWHHWDVFRVTSHFILTCLESLWTSNNIRLGCIFVMLFLDGLVRVGWTNTTKAYAKLKLDLDLTYLEWRLVWNDMEIYGTTWHTKLPRPLPLDAYRSISWCDFNSEWSEWLDNSHEPDSVWRPRRLYLNGLSFLICPQVSKLIVLDPHKRLSVREALQHPWVLGKAARFSHMDTTQRKLQEFNARRKLKAGLLS